MSLKKRDNSQPELRMVVIKDRAKGSVEFKRQNGRKEFHLMQIQQPHEKRFENLNHFPNISTISRYADAAGMCVGSRPLRCFTRRAGATTRSTSPT